MPTRKALWRLREAWGIIQCKHVADSVSQVGLPPRPMGTLGEAN